MLMKITESLLLLPVSRLRYGFWFGTKADRVIYFFSSKTSCGELVAKLSAAQPHYVRTIKPNDNKEVCMQTVKSA